MTAPTLEVDGKHYVEAPAITNCQGCAFLTCFDACVAVGARNGLAAQAFGSGCTDRPVIYVRRKEAIRKTATCGRWQLKEVA